MIADAHVHLDVFAPDELRGVLAEAASSGVELIVTVGMDADSSAAGVKIAQAEPNVCAAVGLHPWNAQDFPEGAPIVRLRELAAHPSVVAIGEIGLDHLNNLFLDLSYRDPELRAMQERVFREQLRLAVELGLPVIVHSRGGAHETTIRVLREEGVASVGGCIQFFEGTPDDVARYAELGFTFTIGSSVTFPDPGGWYDAVRAVPDDALLLETDAPYLPYAGREPARSTPADVRRIGETVARLRGIGEAEVFGASVRNLRRALPRIDGALRRRPA